MDSGINVTTKVANPYVGPRPFMREDAPRFFGREPEARDLLSQVVAGQLVLFYAQSGAGKSSIVNARLIPGLEERNFEVLPVGRVGGDILTNDQCDNIFVFNLLTHLDQSKDAPQRFAKMRLADFLANLDFDGSNFRYIEPSQTPPLTITANQAAVETSIQPRVLIIDQFEEIATTHLEAWEKRSDLFIQIAEAMAQDPYLWVVLVMREDYIATLDLFAHLLPNHLRARYYMRRMDYTSALDAVRKPVENLRPFDPGIAEMLVDNLRLASDSQPQAGHPIYGEFIEPVQLQVVCYQLWASLMKESDTLTPEKRITQSDIDALAKGESLAQFINKALRDFYEQALVMVLEQLPGVVSEGNLRNWFSTQLITEAETRGFVYQGKTQTAGLPNEVVNLLASYYIIRPENRPQGTWFEIVHDRFVGPILQSNREWVTKNQSRLFIDATTWDQEGHPKEKLYEGKQLDAATAEVQQKGSAITQVETQFVSASIQAAKKERDIRRRLIIAGLIVLFTVLSGLSWWALSSRSEAVYALNAAQTANQAAGQARDTAVNAQATVVSQNATAEFQTTALVQQAINQFDSISRLQTQIAPLLVTVLPTETLVPTETKADGGDSPTLVETFNPVESPTTTPTQTATNEPFEHKKIIGKSAKGQDIVVYQFGNGPRHIIFVGGLHAGYAPSTVEIAKRFIAYLRRNQDDVSPAVTVDVILNANPDSLINNQDFSGTIAGRYNANGVDLNTNWDCNWKQDATWPSSNFRVNGGASAFSEPETLALKEYILGNLSTAVIVWEARGREDIRGYYVNPGGCGEVSVFSQPLADQYASAAKYTSNQYEAYSETGAMVDWLDSQGIPSISVYLTDLNNLAQQTVEDQIKGLKAILENYAVAAP